MRHFIGMVGTAARMTAGLSLLAGFLLTANFLLQNTPQAVRARAHEENAAAVRTAGDIYARRGCSTVNGQPGDLSYLAHGDCDCEPIDSPPALADARVP